MRNADGVKQKSALTVTPFSYIWYVSGTNFTKTNIEVLFEIAARLRIFIYFPIPVKELQIHSVSQCNDFANFISSRNSHYGLQLFCRIQHNKLEQYSFLLFRILTSLTRTLLRLKLVFQSPESFPHLFRSLIVPLARK